MTEPIFIGLSVAYNNCCLSSAFNHNRYYRSTAENLNLLRSIRAHKQTYFGQQEQHLRV
jgi:hypothetical protein